MRAWLTIGDTSHTDNLLSAPASERRGSTLLAYIREVIATCSRAFAAAHTYEQLKSLSDTELAARGLKRAHLHRAVFDKLTQGS